MLAWTFPPRAALDDPAGGTRTCNSMPLQAPGTEGSVGLQHAPPARDETASASRGDRQVILVLTDSQAGDPLRTGSRKKKEQTYSRTPALLFPPRRNWPVGCQATRGGLPIGWGARVVFALRSLAGENALCPSSERSFDPNRRRLCPHPQPKTRA